MADQRLVVLDKISGFVTLRLLVKFVLILDHFKLVLSPVIKHEIFFVLLLFYDILKAISVAYKHARLFRIGSKFRCDDLMVLLDACTFTLDGTFTVVLI